MQAVAWVRARPVTRFCIHAGFNCARRGALRFETVACALLCLAMEAVACCSRSRCPERFVQTFYVVRGVSRPHKTCPKCRQYFRDYAKSDKGKAKIAKYLKSPKAKAKAKRNNQSQSHKESSKKYFQSKKGKDAMRRFASTKKGKAIMKKNNKKQYDRRVSDAGLKLFSAIQCTMCMMVSGISITSGKVHSATGFKDKDELTEHLASTFTKGMMLENHGRGDGKWNIGHRIAKAHYDPCNEGDLKRCWNKDNLFAQWEKENQQAQIKLPEMDELLKLQHLWPLSWNDELPPCVC
jgi:hypothetical protein